MLFPSFPDKYLVISLYTGKLESQYVPLFLPSLISTAKLQGIESFGPCIQTGFGYAYLADME